MYTIIIKKSAPCGAEKVKEYALGHDKTVKKLLYMVEEVSGFLLDSDDCMRLCQNGWLSNLKTDVGDVGLWAVELMLL